MDARSMLTPRQREIAAYLARGMSHKAISRETGLSVNTVRAHIYTASARLPGEGSPRIKLVIFTLQEQPPTQAA